MKEPTQADYEAGRILHEAWYNVGRATAPPFDLMDRFDRLRWIETAKVSHAAHAKAQLEQDWKTLSKEDAPLVKWAKQIPPKRPWVGLTDAQYDEIWRMDLNNKDLMDKTIAKLKELNT